MRGDEGKGDERRWEKEEKRIKRLVRKERKRGRLERSQR
jgi:hypothetical protein